MTFQRLGNSDKCNVGWNKPVVSDVCTMMNPHFLISTWRAGCDPRPVYVAFMEKKVGPRRISFRVLQF
jgi:hypothetical protein